MATPQPPFLSFCPDADSRSEHEAIIAAINSAIATMRVDVLENVRSTLDEYVTTISELNAGAS